jgi:hypothetical protein
MFKDLNDMITDQLVIGDRKKAKNNMETSKISQMSG